MKFSQNTPVPSYNTDTKQLVLGPGTIASKATAAKASVVDADKVFIIDSADGKLKTVLASVLKTYTGS